MPLKNVIFFVLSMLIFVCLFTIGVAVAERSITVGVLAILGVIVFMGIGFTLKRKMNEG